MPTSLKKNTFSPRGHLTQPHGVPLIPAFFADQLTIRLAQI